MSPFYEEKILKIGKAVECYETLEEIACIVKGITGWQKSEIRKRVNALISSYLHKIINELDLDAKG